MLTMTFLGVGSAFSKRHFQSNALVEAWELGPDQQRSPDDTLLIDFGTTGPLALHHLMQQPGFTYLNDDGRINYPAIHCIYLSHTHSDHIGGLEELAFSNMFNRADTATTPPFKPLVIAAAPLLANLWDHSLCGGMGAINGRRTQMLDFFETLAINPHEAGHDRFTLMHRYDCKPFRTDHIRIERPFDWPSYGLNIEDVQTGESMFFSGDSRFDYGNHASMLERARVIFHDAQLLDDPDPVHALYDELLTLPESLRRKMWLYHYADNYDSGAFDDINRHFAGFAEPFERYVIFE